MFVLSQLMHASFHPVFKDADKQEVSFYHLLIDKFKTFGTGDIFAVNESICLKTCSDYLFCSCGDVYTLDVCAIAKLNMQQLCNVGNTNFSICPVWVANNNVKIQQKFHSLPKLYNKT